MDKALVTVGRTNIVCSTGVMFSRFSGERGVPFSAFFVCTFPRGACLALLARFALAFTRLKNANK